MATVRRFLYRLVHFFQPHRAESELERELAAHLGVLEDEYKRRGLTNAEARLAARRALGGVAQTKELHRDARSFRWLNDVRQDTRFAVRSLVRAPGFAAIVVGTLAVVGIYGGIAFAVSRRTREIGIRMALGASNYQVFRAIVGDMLLLAAVGIGAGVAGGALLTRYLEQMLFDLTPLDPAVFIATPVFLAGAVLVAAFLSARPALTAAPLAALRHE